MTYVLRNSYGKLQKTYVQKKLDYLIVTSVHPFKSTNFINTEVGIVQTTSQPQFTLLSQLSTTDRFINLIPAISNTSKAYFHFQIFIFIYKTGEKVTR